MCKGNLSMTTRRICRRVVRGRATIVGDTLFLIFRSLSSASWSRLTTSRVCVGGYSNSKLISNERKITISFFRGKADFPLESASKKNFYDASIPVGIIVLFFFIPVVCPSVYFCVQVPAKFEATIHFKFFPYVHVSRVSIFFSNHFSR